MTNLCSNLAYIRVVMAYPENGNNGEVIETHAIPSDSRLMLRKQVRKVLGQWMQGSDRMRGLTESTWESGVVCAPFLIETEDGEHTDIFAQLIY